MLNLYFLLGEKKVFLDGEELLVNILDRLSLYKTAYEIDYCYTFTPPTRKLERSGYTQRKFDVLVEKLKDKEVVMVGMGWMAIELLHGTAKTRTSQIIGCRFPNPPFRYDAWFTYDPAAAIFDPNLYVDIMACISAAIRYAGRQIIINTNINPYNWTNL
jgi:hypothetical protein